MYFESTRESICRFGCPLIWILYKRYWKHEKSKKLSMKTKPWYSDICYRIAKSCELSFPRQYIRHSQSQDNVKNASIFYCENSPLWTTEFIVYSVIVETVQYGLQSLLSILLLRKQSITDCRVFLSRAPISWDWSVRYEEG